MSEEVKNDSVEAKTDEVSSPVASDEASKETTATAEVETKEEAKAEVPAEFKDLIEKVEKMSVLELHSLVKVLESHFGVSAQAVAVAGPAAAGGGAEEKDEFTVELSDAGAQKIAVIKVVKEALNLGLKEAKDMVDAAPSVVKEAMKKEDAEALKAKLEEAGAKVTLK